MDERLTALEIKLSYAEDLLDTLNHTVFRQQEQIAFLQKQVRELQNQMSAMPASPPSTLQDEAPPHY